MKRVLFIIGFACAINNAQVIELSAHNTELSDTLGSEMIFAVDVTNVSQVEQTIYIVRTNNSLPSGWYSALCFDVCFSGELDSVVTSPTYGSSPLQPNETREISVHVFPLENQGIGYIQIKVGAMSDGVDYFFDFTTSTTSTSVDDLYSPHSYKLLQNYPNPFNPSTTITFDLPKKEQVTVTVYNSIGQKVKTLLNRTLDPGRHAVDFNAESLTAGVYFYRVSTPGFVSTKKMILLK